MIKSKSSQFYERWSKAEFINTRLWGMCMALCGICLALTAAFIYLNVKPKPIYFVPGVWQAGVAAPSVNPSAIASAFTASWLLNWNNFNPSTSKEVYRRALQFMSPNLISKTRSRLDTDLKEIERSAISSLFSIEGDPLIRADKKGFEVRIKGTKVLYMGKEIVKEQIIIFIVTVRVIGPTDQNPYGLLIDTIDQEQNT